MFGVDPSIYSPVPGVMPPVRRVRRLHLAASPYSTDRRAEAKSDHASDGAPPAPATLLPDDVLFAIFSHSSGAADVARCAATCRRWGSVVAARAAAICRALPVPPPPATFLPHLALGVFFPQHKNARAGARLRFVPTAAALSSTYSRRLLAGPITTGSAVVDLELDLDHARPVASRNGRVVLQLRRAGCLTLCVWNPSTGAVSVLPPLSGKDYPGTDYACAILTSEDLATGPLSTSPGFFRVLVVYERRRRSFTALRCYSSDTGGWGAEAKKPGDKISGRVLRQLRPAVVLGGVAYWSMRRAAFGVRLDGGTSLSSSATMDVCSVPYQLKLLRLNDHMVGVSPEDGRMRFIVMGFFARKLLAIDLFTSRRLRQASGDQIDDDGIMVNVQEIKLPRNCVPNNVKLRWFGEKSGTIIITAGETGSSTSDVFAFNLFTGSVEKLAEGVSNHECRNLYGYEVIPQHSLRP